MSIAISRDTIKFAVIDPDPAMANALSIGFGLRWPECQVFTATAGTPGIALVQAELPQLVATRMKKRGMSWTKRGGNRMARLINMANRITQPGLKENSLLYQARTAIVLGLKSWMQ